MACQPKIFTICPIKNKVANSLTSSKNEQITTASNEVEKFYEFINILQF